ncbi:MAG: response regulator [Magnetococcales bacterium]|nr:response regulator [Magnetococcales bacterium]
MDEALKHRILVVDDEKTNIDVLVNVLKEDYRLLVAKGGIQALKRAATDPQPDLIILDIVMPDMDGYEVCRQLKADPRTRMIPVIFYSAMEEADEETIGLELGAVDYLTKPISPPIVRARLRTHLALATRKRALEQEVRQRTAQLEQRTAELEAAQEAQREAMHNLLTLQVTPGVYWIQVPEVGLYILCGCPAEVVKHLMRQGFIKTATSHGVAYETGPNVILLSDVLVQNGGFSNLSEFPVLQMLYRQGMIIPKHPNNTGVKPMLIGSREQVLAQMEYIHRGNYGLNSREEIMACGVDADTAEILMRIKLKFAFGTIRSPRDFIDTLEVTRDPVEIRQGVTVRRIGFNRFRFEYRGKTSDVDLNLPAGSVFESPYPLGRHRFQRHYFAVLHTGEGDGWDISRPSMGSVIMFQGRIYLVDAGPGILQSLTALGIDISEVEGIFHTHGHDDHFGGLPALIQCGRRLKYYATALVRTSVAAKFAALLSLEVCQFENFFEIHDLESGVWNNCGGLQVKPIHSPHPVETTLFLFRALDRDGYRTYAHWADLSSFQVLDRMAGDGFGDVPRAFIDQVKRDYLQPADLKKLDAGGGMIHGLAEDFQQDASERLILAHTNRGLTTREMEIGSETHFGALDVLIKGEQDYLQQQAARHLSGLFPNVAADQVRMLLNAPIVDCNAGTIIWAPGRRLDHLDMVLTGTVAYLDAAAGVKNHLSFGSFIGSQSLFGGSGEEGTYRAVSHCSLLRIGAFLMQAFLEANGLLDHMRELNDRIRFLRRTWLFGEQLTYQLLGDLAAQLEAVEIPADQILPLGPDPVLWLVAQGAIHLQGAAGNTLEEITRGGFFGEQTLLSPGAGSPFVFRAPEPARLFRLPAGGLREIPIVYWKMMEVHGRRRRLE